MGAAGALRPRMEHRAAGSPHTGSGTADASLLTPSASASVRKARQWCLFTAIRRIPWAVFVKVLVATGHNKSLINVLPSTTVLRFSFSQGGESYRKQHGLTSSGNGISESPSLGQVKIRVLARPSQPVPCGNPGRMG